MGIWGKILGGTAGLVVGGPIGAVIGAVAGHAYDTYRSESTRAIEDERDPEGMADIPPYGDAQETRKVAFATAVIVLAAKLAKVDGAVTREEIRAFKRHFPIQDDEVGGVAAIYDQAKTSAQGFEPYARQVAVLFGNAPTVLEELLHGLFRIAAADGRPNAAELRYLASVAGILGFGPIGFARMHARFMAGQQQEQRQRPADAPDSYAVLGLPTSATVDEIKATYRRLVREHHPDRLIAQGMPEEFVAQANRSLAAINAAYDEIAKRRGIA
ncbi:TerB family tellurite resistance protein [Marinivivus vitaminiproducens]|nr:TerB family tellurite resistance protein [Geminicoccaceae bacterium SCSIO 64248]